MSSVPLNTRQDRGHIVRWAPPILEDIQTELARAVDVRVEHLTDELDAGWLVGVLLLEVHHQAEGAIFERGVGGANNHSVPIRDRSVIVIKTDQNRASYQVMTLSAIGDAETPAGGSVCIRWKRKSVTPSTRFRSPHT